MKDEHVQRYCSHSTTIRPGADRALRAASMRPVGQSLGRPFGNLDTVLGNEQRNSHEWPLPPAVWSRP